MHISSKPITIKGASGVQRIYIQSQMHSNESHGTPVLYELLNHLKKINVIGEITIYPCVNNEGFFEYCVNRNGLFDPDSGQNWNRIDFSYLKPIINFFNDNLTQLHSVSDIEKLIDNLNIKSFEGDYGSLKHIYNFVEPLKIILKSHYVIDVHTPEYGVEHIYCNNTSLFVNAFEIDPTIVDNTNATTFRKFVMNLFESLANLGNDVCTKYFTGREMVTIELPSHITIDDEYISNWAEKFVSVLNICGFVERNKLNVKTAVVRKTHDIGNLKYYYSKIDGIFVLAVPVGSTVEKDELIMTILAIDGTKQYVRAIKRGKFLCFRNKKTTLRGEWIARVLELEQESYYV